jgi:hypothetical protein
MKNHMLKNLGSDLEKPKLEGQKRWLEDPLPISVELPAKPCISRDIEFLHRSYKEVILKRGTEPQNE